MSLAARRRASYALGAVSFAESSFFLIPPDALLIPMVIAKRQNAWRLAALCMATSVLGGLAGYLIGAFLFDEIARPLLAFYGYADKFADFAVTYNEWGAWIVLIAGGLTPFPFKVVTIASGATGLGLPVFILSSMVARTLRFYTVAGLLYWFGPPIRDFIERRLTTVFTLATLALVGGFLAIRLIG